MDIQTEKKMRKTKSLLGTLLAIFAFASCEVPGGAQKNDGNDVDLYGMPIDVSNVGYHQGESKIPSYPVSVTLTAPADGRRQAGGQEYCAVDLGIILFPIKTPRCHTQRGVLLDLASCEEYMLNVNIFVKDYDICNLPFCNCSLFVKS